MEAASGHSGRVLVVPSVDLERVGLFQGFCPDASRYLDTLFKPDRATFRPRSEVEDDPSWKQIIPYVVFRAKDKLFCYTRGTSQGETRLHRLLSIGVGGHVEEADAGGLATVLAYEMALQRELQEEVIINVPGIMQLVGLINDDSTSVGRVHLGVVHLYELETPDVVPREEGLADAGFRTITSLVADCHRMESWSRLCFGALFCPPPAP